VAKTWTHGRVMLAGDAAHLNNPLGGLGMNSGIHDVWNLTDKLRAILKDGADGEALLARYERQRRTICTEFVQAQTIRNKKAMEDRSPDAQARHQAELSAIAADPDRRRDYLLTQSMYRSREREEAVA
jgi:3-(3-hydroxy-phenyl)propionate hydroxylase